MPPAQKQITELYYVLASSEEETRVLAAQTFVSALSGFQNSYVPSKSIKLVTSDDQAAVAFHHDVTYAITRLFKGITSSRDHARQGFTLALIHLLRQPFMTVADVGWLLSKLVKLTHVRGVRAEEKETKFGRLFGIMALVESGTFERSSFAVAKEVLSLLNENRKGSPYLDQVTARILGNAIKSKGGLDEWVFNEVLGSRVESAFDLYVLLSAKKWEKLHPKGWDANSSVLSFKNLDRLSSILHKTSDQYPKINIVWELLAKVLKTLPKTQEFGVAAFHKRIVTDLLLCGKSKREVLLGLAVTQLLCDELFPSRVALLLNLELYKMTLPKAPFRAQARTLIREITERGREEAEKRLAELRREASKADKRHNGEVEPTEDQSKPKAQGKSVAEASGLESKSHASELDRVIASVSGDAGLPKENVPNQGAWKHALGQLISLSPSASWPIQQDIVKFLASVLRGERDDAQVPTSPSLADMFRIRFLSITDLILGSADPQSRERVASSLLTIITGGQETLKFPDGAGGPLTALCWVEYITKLIAAVDPSLPCHSQKKETFESCRKGLTEGASKNDKLKAIEDLTDLFLGILVARHDVLDLPSQLVLRNLENDLSIDSWKAIIGVVGGKNMEDAMSDDDEDEDDSGDDSERSEGKTESEEESESDSDDDEDQSAEHGATASGRHHPGEANRNLLEALKKSTEQDTPSSNPSDDEKSADDQEMMENDSKLAEVFRRRRELILAAKRAPKEAEKQQSNFRIRCLKLIQTHIRRQGFVPVFVQLLPELFHSITACGDTREPKPLVSKALQVAQDIGKCKLDESCRSFCDTGKLQGVLGEAVASMESLKSVDSIKMVPHFIAKIIQLADFCGTADIAKWEGITRLLTLALSPRKESLKWVRWLLSKGASRVGGPQRVDLKDGTPAQRIVYGLMSRHPDVVAKALAPMLGEVLVLSEFGAGDSDKEKAESAVTKEQLSLVCRAFIASEIARTLLGEHKEQAKPHLQVAILDAFVSQVKSRIPARLSAPLLGLYGLVLRNTSRGDPGVQLSAVKAAMDLWRGQCLKARGVLPKGLADG